MSATGGAERGTEGTRTTRLPSITRRLGRVMIVVSLAWGIAVAGVIWLTVQHEVDDLLDGTLQEAAEIVYAMLLLQGERLPLGEGAMLPAPPHEESLVWQIVSPQGRVLLRSHRAPAAALLPGPHTGLADAAGDWRVYGLVFGPAQQMLYVAQRGADRREARYEVAGISAASALAVGLLCAAWLRTRVRRELAPLNALSAAVVGYEPLEAGSTLAAPGRAELLPMHAAIVDLGQRLAQRVSSERAFSAHAAHALRTPLAGMDAQLAVALRECPPALVPRLQRTREAAGRLRRVVTALLTMFRSGVDLHWQPVDLPALLERLPVDGLTVRVERGVPFQADPDLLAAALMNLLDNAVRHRAALVRVAVDQDGDDTVLALQDDGSGIEPEQRRQMQAALDAQQYEGRVGLGLLLADRVARAHHGKLSLLDSPSGCCVQLRLGPPPVA